MKVRIFTLSGLIVAVVLLVSGGVRPSAAQLQSSLAPDKAHGAVPLPSAPALFTENASQFDEPVDGCCLECRCKENAHGSNEAQFDYA